MLSYIVCQHFALNYGVCYVFFCQTFGSGAIYIDYTDSDMLGSLYSVWSSERFIFKSPNYKDLFPFATMLAVCFDNFIFNQCNSPVICWWDKLKFDYGGNNDVL